MAISKLQAILNDINAAIQSVVKKTESAVSFAGAADQHLMGDGSLRDADPEMYGLDNWTINSRILNFNWLITPYGHDEDNGDDPAILTIHADKYYPGDVLHLTIAPEANYSGPRDRACISRVNVITTGGETIPSFIIQHIADMRCRCYRLALIDDRFYLTGAWELLKAQGFSHRNFFPAPSSFGFDTILYNFLCSEIDTQLEPRSDITLGSLLQHIIGNIAYLFSHMATSNGSKIKICATVAEATAFSAANPDYLVLAEGP